MKNHLKFAILPLLLLSPLAMAAQSIDKSISAPDNMRLNLKVQRGEVKIDSWDKSEIQVKGTLDELSEGFILEANGNAVTLEDKMPRQYSGNNKAGSNLTIMVPKELKLYVKGVSADYQLDNLSGDINVESVSGAVKANKLNNEIHLHTVSGEITTQTLKGKTVLETVSGEIQDKQSEGQISYKLVSGELEADSQASDIRVEVVSGDAKLNLGQVASLKGQSVSGDLSFNLKGLSSKASLDSVSGDITIKLPESVNANFDINGGPGGDIDNYLTEDKPTRGKYVPHSSLQFQMGNGNAEVNISTISGEISLEKNG
ncbi:DUF4097 domain-containing protein [Shewanella sp. AS1]|uniref:DUF4097 family beta strand repeat-containing protein n=1 Tax=Shewanella sp. AS1 TaxID=2907626 RepID=UPI001F3FF310|nr:DUF4097 family beta strand repeat-containing protein [Shewanella sp. AS1]MCE9680579.1 DUF4097 domain-containing protein [Shewanella sp. AS1]